jgi:hypothetical protein
MRFINVRRAAGLEPPLDVQNEQYDDAASYEEE